MNYLLEDIENGNNFAGSSTSPGASKSFRGLQSSSAATNSVGLLSRPTPSLSSLLSQLDLSLSPPPPEMDGASALPSAEVNLLHNVIPPSQSTNSSEMNSLLTNLLTQHKEKQEGEQKGPSRHRGANQGRPVVSAAKGNGGRAQAGELEAEHQSSHTSDEEVSCHFAGINEVKRIVLIFWEQSARVRATSSLQFQGA